MSTKARASGPAASYPQILVVSFDWGWWKHLSGQLHVYELEIIFCLFFSNSFGLSSCTSLGVRWGWRNTGHNPAKVELFFKSPTFIAPFEIDGTEMCLPLGWLVLSIVCFVVNKLYPFLSSPPFHFQRYWFVVVVLAFGGMYLNYLTEWIHLIHFLYQVFYLKSVWPLAKRTDLPSQIFMWIKNNNK